MGRFYRARHTLMIQGTCSGAGKSTLVAGLCRVLARRGRRVAPFKPQNMSLNSAVAADGGEIARAQVLQAQAARVAPRTDMNPVLLKPSSDTRAQVVLAGKPHAELEADRYLEIKNSLMAAVLAAFERLRRDFDVLIVEGAGSPAEPNLRANDIANMGFAEVVDCPVLLVADIDRGGALAHVVGTLACLTESERSRVAGIVINRFRGARAILQPGIDWLERETAKPVLGVLPYFQGLVLDAEDALPEPETRRGRFRVVVPVYPRISNHTDLEPLRLHPGVELVLLGPRQAWPAADLAILPGSKNVRDDLAFLRAQGWDEALGRHLRYGGKLIGLCGGLQMLGRAIHDPHGVEGRPGTSPGLGWLGLETTLGREKTLRNVAGRLACGAAFSGYEIHMGCTPGVPLEGVHSADDRIFGTYIHGLFDSPQACNALLAWAGLSEGGAVDLAALREASLERLADAVESELRWEALTPLL